ncbi:MAG: response regulator [Gemmatimonadota bacterium]|nr:response regulator [Gemmatimonadota bacterium]
MPKTGAAITRAHRGFVDVASEPGRGSSFVVYLPAVSTPPEAALPATVPDPSDAYGRRRGHGELVLVVDDEAAVRSITRQSLESFGYRVLTAADGTEAVAVYGERGDDIEVVLLDMVMPIMGGASAPRALRRMSPDVRIVAVSGGELRRSEAGDRPPEAVAGVLAKPYTAHDLLDTLAHVLGRDVTS